MVWKLKSIIPTTENCTGVIAKGNFLDSIGNYISSSYAIKRGFLRGKNIFPLIGAVNSPCGGKRNIRGKPIRVVP